jgi:hypothetical protein
LGDAHIVGDDLAEMLGVGQQPTVRPLDHGPLDT